MVLSDKPRECLPSFAVLSPFPSLKESLEASMHGQS